MSSRNVLVTGGNRGIGRAVAERFQAQGDRVAILSRSGQEVDGLLTVAGDVTDSRSVDDAVLRATEGLGGPIDVLVANAGVTDDGLLTRMSDESFERVLDTNLTGAFRCARAVSRDMIRRRGGRLVFVSSVVGLHGSTGQANYAASKAGLVGLARSLARELGPRGITANVVAPGFVETEMTAGLPQSQKEVYRQEIPTGRFAQPEEIAAAVAFLASPDAGYVNGAVLPVDGGLGMGH